MTTRRTGALAAALCLASIPLVAGCSQSSGVSRSESAPRAQDQAVKSGASDQNSASEKAANVQVLDGSPAQTGRQVVSTATMAVKVDDVVPAKEKATASIEGLGGDLYNEQTSLSTRSTATVTYKVPPEKFNEALRDLAGLGKLSSQDVKTEDVTQQVVDLDARIRAAEASTQRVTDLVGRTNNVTELANLENEVQRRQAELESLRGQKRTLDARIDLATIVLTLSNDDAPAKPSEAHLPGFLDGLSGGWTAFINVMTVTGAVVGALIPFAWIAVLVAVLIWLLRRKSRSARAPAGAPAPPA